MHIFPVHSEMHVLQFSAGYRKRHSQTRLKSELPLRLMLPPEISCGRVHGIAWFLSEVRGCAGNDVYLIPVFFFHSFRRRGIGLKYDNSWCIQQIIIIEWITCFPMRLIELMPHRFCVQAWIQCAASTKTFFLCCASPCYTTAGVGCRGEIQDTDSFSGFCVCRGGFEASFR